MLTKYLKMFLAGAIFFVFFAINPAEQKLTAATQTTDNNFSLTWSSDSYVPPGYAGLALPTMGSQIKIFALPTKRLNIDPEKLTYRWILDGEIIDGAGGQGKSVFSFRVKKWPGDYHVVESQVLDGNNMIWRGLTEIKISKAEAIFQLPSSDYSITGSFSAKTGQTLKILAVPFFFNVKDLGSLNFQWELDGQELINSDTKDFNIFSLTIPSAQLKKTLIKNLKLFISDKTNIDQQASSKITLEIK